MKRKPEDLYREHKISIPEIGSTAAKILVSVVALLHLVISPIHVSGLLLLENLICGFIMFLFILFGLLALFNALRTKEGQVISMIAEIFILCLVIVIGSILASIYMNAIRFQTTLSDVVPVQKAFILSVTVCVLYGIGAVLYLVDVISKIKAGKHV